MTEKSVSIVIPAFNEQNNLPVLIQKIKEELEKRIKFEVIIVNDGSSDRTEHVAMDLHRKDKRIQVISFARNFGHQYALKAGLDFSKGDCVISMDADLQHPVSLIPQMIHAWEKGYDIVYTVRQESKNESFFKRITSRLFYIFFNFLTDLNLPQGAADFRLLDRRVVEQIKALPERMLFLRGMISWIGFKQKGIAYIPEPRFSGKSSYTFKKMVSLAATGAVSFSLKPLRIAIYMGILVALLGCMFMGYVFYMKLFKESVISGWASLMSVIMILGGAQLFIMGIIGEYIGMIFMETKHRPQYIISTTTLTSEGNNAE